MREDGMFEDIEKELEWFDEPSSFNNLCVRLNAKFGGDFTLKGRFDTGKTRAHYVLMPCAALLTGLATLGCSKVLIWPWLRWWWRMDTGCRVSWTGRSLTVLEAMSKNWGVKGEAAQGNMDLDG